jgi:hypothetical protein
MSAYWGCDVDYINDQWPHAAPLHVSSEKLTGLEMPDIENSSAVQLVRRNARILTDHYGHCRSAINYGGPLNNAVSVLGETAFEICAADPYLAKEVLRKMGQAVILVHDLVESPINGIQPEKVREGDWGIGNCPVGQISPSMYQNVVLQVDLDFRQYKRGGGFSLHHCGIFHPYVNVYQLLKPTDIDVGPGTDLQITRQAYPNVKISAYFDPAGFSSLTQDKVDAIVSKTIKAAAPIDKITYIRAIEVGPELSDDSVRAMMTVFERLNISGGKE